MRAWDEHGRLDVPPEHRGRSQTYMRVSAGEVSSATASERTKRRRASELRRIGEFNNYYYNVIVHNVAPT